MKRILLLLIIAMLILACGNEPPVIETPIYQVIVYQQKSFNLPNASVFLSIFFDLYDENGIEDINEVTFIHIDNEIAWTINSKNLEKVVWGNTSYYGYSFIQYQNAQQVLLGDYLIQVLDNAENITEKVITVELPDYDEPIFKVSAIPYQVHFSNDNQELTITGESFSSCELKFMNYPGLFNHTRKKFLFTEKINLEPYLTEITNSKGNTDHRVSVRVNKDEDNTLIYFIAEKDL
ncbi:MAG: hypothetical protein MJB14_15840 [Spirochaetes bacterium]|nr:hypothetical protein [Spirochaetota bacterium]